MLTGTILLFMVRVYLTQIYRVYLDLSRYFHLHRSNNPFIVSVTLSFHRSPPLLTVSFGGSDPRTPDALLNDRWPEYMDNGSRPVEWHQIYQARKSTSGRGVVECARRGTMAKAGAETGCGRRKRGIFRMYGVKTNQL